MATSSGNTLPADHVHHQPDAIHFFQINEALLCLGLGVLGGLVVGAGHGALEALWFHTLRALERRGHIKRLAPSINVTMNEYRQDSFWAVAVSHIPLFIGLAAFRRGLLERATPRLDLVGCWTFTWVVMVLHDTWFWAIHTQLHRFKWLYKHVHLRHHLSGGDITVYSTAFGDAADLFAIFPTFYALVMAWVYLQPQWNPLAFVFLGWAFNCVNMMGHCGYELPSWVFVPGSLGVLLTPMAQRPKHHYIHHLDPRYNRSLYFTWWDRLMGTYKGSHSKIVEGSQRSARE